MSINFIGNRDVYDYFKNIYQNNKMGQIYIFDGPEGIGKKYFALLLAKSMLCKNKVFCGCDECSACRKVNNNIHNDLYVYEPVNLGISIDQIRMIIQRLKFKPVESNYSIHIVDAVETMRIEAANAFLKIIEEPPEYALIILITTLLDALPATVRSRCQLIKFSKISSQEIRDRLISLNVESNKAYLISLWANGSLSKALSIDFENYLDIRNKAVEILKFIVQKGRGKSFPDFLPAGFKRERDKNEYLRENMDVLFYFLADLIREIICIIVKDESSHHPDIEVELRGLCKGIKVDDMFVILQRLEKIKWEYRIFHKDYLLLLQKMILMSEISR
jgi:DNA polymerase-3 subunit delta'